MELIETMHAWCDDADAIALELFGIDVATDRKADGTPVTAADRGIESRLRERIAAEAPGVIVGEEEGGALPDHGVAWILDPIDGTKNFARGVPVFATLLARWEDGELTHAIVSAPALGSRWWATPDGAFSSRGPIGASSSRGPIRVSAIDRLAEASVCTGGLQAEWLSAEQRTGLHRVLDSGARHRGFGDFWGHLLVAQGSLEAMIEYAPLKLWDIAAPRCILEAAGGRVTSLSGDAALAEGPVVASNGAVHDEILAALAEDRTVPTKR